MKRILIFTVSTGAGHNQVARALENEFMVCGYDVVKLDVLKETSKFLDILISDGYRLLATNLPKMYGKLYKITDRKKLNSGFTKLFARIHRNKIHRLIQNYNPDLIIGTHPFIVTLVADLKKRGIIHVPFISIVTDYQAHQTYISRYVDAYITGSYYTSQSLQEKGVHEEKIYTYGIPIRREFLGKQKEMHKKTEYLTILLMGGSMGVKSIRRTLENLVLNRHSLRIIVICGNNEILKQELKSRYKNTSNEKKKISIYGFTRHISRLMDISDIIITKPGGLTVSEAIAKNVPMIIPYLIPGQEEENADFLVKSNVAIRVNDIKKINEVIDYLIENPKVIKQMKNNMRKLASTYSLENIIGLADKLIYEYRCKWGKTQEK
ncbi:MAG TPA: glycosyltransferase [Clostridiales bacterium]|nr:glycosyltransferase [Clostridiales bacterium]